MGINWFKYDKPAISIGIYRYGTLIRLWKRGLHFGYKSNIKFNIRLGWFNQIKLVEPEPYKELLPDFIIDYTGYGK